MKCHAEPSVTAQSDSLTSSEAMKYCSGNVAAPASYASSAPLTPNADGQCGAGPEMANASPRRGCKSSSMRGRSIPAASK
eukprot:3505743-Alexandrium_andersonii.AAC.2